MPPVVLAVLKYLFLLLIFMFLLRAVRVMYLEIAGPPKQVGRPATGGSNKPGRPPATMVVVGQDKVRKTFTIGDELVIGRNEKCDVVITDTYASEMHARVFSRGDSVLLEDLGSTNGTQLNRKRVSSAVALNRGDKGRIGKTELEFRK